MDKETEITLVKQFSKNKAVTYKALQSVFGKTTLYIVQDGLFGLESAPVICYKVHSKTYYYGNAAKDLIGTGWNFADDAVFKLTKHGTDILYDVEKEEKNQKQFDETYRLNKRIYRATLAALVVATISLTIAILAMLI